MTLDDDIKFWEAQMPLAKHDKLKAVCFGIAAGLRIASKEYGLSLQTPNVDTSPKKESP